MYGVSSFTLQQRTREFGIRVALGARPRTLTTMLIRQFRSIRISPAEALRSE